MTDVLPEVAESLDRVYPVPDVSADWDGVLASADARRKRPLSLGRLYSRRRLVALAAAMLVGVLTASAFATVRDLFEADYRKVTRTVDDVQFSLSVPRAGWENGPDVRVGEHFRNGSLFVSKSTVGPQAAEAVIFWTSFPRSGQAAPCGNLRNRPVGRSAAALASAVAGAPGVRLLRRPSDVIVGGRPATYVVVRVFLDLGCHPGYFFTWEPSYPRGKCWGACWLRSSVNDTIRMWIVEINGKRLVLQAEVTEQGNASLQREISKIVRSIRFG